MTREEKFAEKADKGFGVCLTQTCPLREECLHWILRTYVPEDRYYTNTVNLNHPLIQTNKCTLYMKDQTVRMPMGISNIYYDMPERIAKPLKQHLIHYFSRKRYYEYHNGTRPVPREHEQHILQAAKNYGWDKPIAFNSYIEDYLW